MRKYACLPLVLVAACATGKAGSSGVLMSPRGNTSEPAWSEQEEQRDAALRNLRESPEASFHLLRVRTAEPSAHVSEKSDLVLMVMSGKVEVEVGYRTLPAGPGDIIEVPRGVAYRVKNVAQAPSTVYLVYTPSLAAGDRRAVTEPQSESAWKWNLWVQ